MLSDVAGLPLTFHIDGVPRCCFERVFDDKILPSLNNLLLSDVSLKDGLREKSRHCLTCLTLEFAVVVATLSAMAFLVNVSPVRKIFEMLEVQLQI